MMRRRSILASIAFLIFMALPVFLTFHKVNAVTAADWQAGRIIDDDIFTDSGSMSVADIQNFLNAQVPNCDTNGTQPAAEYGRPDLTHAQYAALRGWAAPPYVCLKNYYEVPKTSPGAGMPDNSYNHGGNPPAGSISAAQMIYNAAQQYNISPKVLLVNIRKESAGPLTNDSWPLPSQYTYAMGAHCPDSGPNGSANCDPNYAGFSIQISESAALLRYYLDNMNQSWWPYKKLGNNTIQYNPDTSCGSSVVNITTMATAALYTYTPYQPNAGALAAGYGTAPCGAYGNRNFWLYFNEWWGTTNGLAYYACHNQTNIAGAATGESIVRNRQVGSNTDKLSLVIPNNTGSACVEFHTWNDASLQAWSQHIPSNSGSINPAYNSIISADTDGTGSRMYDIAYTNTGSGMIEIHGWDASGQHWLSHTATNRPAVNPADAEVIAADLNGDGKDEFYLVQYRNTGSGMVEVHGWAPGEQQWASHVATNLPAIDPTQGEVIAADLNGDGKDKLVYVKYANTGSGNVEVHVWSDGLQNWSSHIVTNLPTAGFDSTKDAVIAADLNGDGKDELYFVKYSGTSSGMVEVHGWAPGEQQWASHTATSSGAF